MNVMDNATPRSRKLPIRLTILFLALIGIFFIILSIFNNQSSPKTEAKSSDLEPVVIIAKTEDIKLAEAPKITESGQKIIYLTFDDGPGDFTNALLDILDKYEVKATFFVTGRGDDAVIRREDEEGHTVALHTWSHNYAYIYANTNNYFTDLSQVAERVKNITGKDAKLVRFPGGSSNLVSRRYDGKTKIMTTLSRELEARGYQYFDWNVDSDDAGRANSSDTVYTNVVTHLKDGPNVVLQHDIKPYSVEAVERIIQYGNENNFVFDKLELNSPIVHHSLNN